MRGYPAVSAIILSLGLAGCAHQGASGKPATTGGATPAATSAGARSGSAPQPAMTPMDLQAAMKKIGASYGAMMKKLQANDTAGAAGDGKVLATTFGDVEKFWAEHNKPDAVKWAQEARMHASSAAGAAAANDSAKATAAA